MRQQPANTVRGNLTAQPRAQLSRKVPAFFLRSVRESDFASVLSRAVSNQHLFCAAAFPARRFLFGASKPSRASFGRQETVERASGARVNFPSARPTSRRGQLPHQTRIPHPAFILNGNAGMSAYSELLRDPRWQRKRLEVFQRDDWKCTQCGETEKELHVHHVRYIPYLKPWEYDNSLLKTLCHSCHKSSHRFAGHGLVVCWTLEEISQPECPMAFPWTGGIIDRWPDSEIDPDYECVGSDGKVLWINASCGKAFVRPPDVKGDLIAPWVKQCVESVGEGLYEH